MLNYKKSILFLIALLSLGKISFAEEAVKWNIEKSTHFIVYYKEAKELFIKELVTYAEDYYDRIAENLGLRRYDFWLWDRRAKIYIYNDSKDYIASTNQPSWSAGYAVSSEKIIYTYPYAQGFFETVLPHEMGHIIFRELVGFNNPAVPLWLDEGVAIYQEKSMAEQAVGQVKDAIRKGTFMPFEKLSASNPKALQDDASVKLFYLEAASMVGYLIKGFGKDNFVIFCQHLRDLKDFQGALSATYPFNNARELGGSWEKYLKNQ